MWNLDDTTMYEKVYCFLLDKAFTWGSCKDEERREYIRAKVASDPCFPSAHDLTDYWDQQEELQEDQTKPIESEFGELIEKKYYAIDHELSDKIRAIAKQWDVSATSLVNLWLMRKIQRDQLELIESDIQSQKKYRAIDKEILEKIHDVAKKRGISTDTLLNLWLQEKLQEQKIESKVLVS